MAVDLAIVCVILLWLLVLAITGWWCAIQHNRELKHDLDVALGWHEQRTQDDAVVHTPQHLIEDGETP